MPTIHLPRATNRTRTGPRLGGGLGHVELSYDYEADDGGVEWVTVRFEDVLQVEVKPDVCCTVGDIVPSGQVRVKTDGARLSSLLERWTEAVGHHEWQKKKGGASRFRHFTLYFDDAGCVHVIAATVEVLEPSAEGPPNGRSPDQPIRPAR